MFTVFEKEGEEKMLFSRPNHLNICLYAVMSERQPKRW